jgi:tetratricopeptide (TPR) repeat protein
LIGLAETDNARGDFQAGLPRYQEALGFFERLDNNFGISWALGGLAAYEENANNDLHAAAEIMTTSVAYARQQPDIRHLGWFLCILADLQRDLDRLDEARRNLAEGLALLVETADRPGQAFSKLRLAGLALQEGLLARARPFLCDTISLSYDTYTLSYAAQGIYLAGLLLLHRGEIEGGLRLCAAAETIYPPVRRRLLRSDLAAIDRQIDEVKSRLGEVKFVRLWNEGSVYRLPAAVELALLLL